MALAVYNTLTRSKEEFRPIHEGVVGIYVCGPTVYSDSHVGHAKSYVSFDVIVRYLRYLGYKVLYVQNITDVGHLLDDGEDRMLKQSRIEKTHPMQIAETITRSYFEDMDALGILRPVPRAISLNKSRLSRNCSRRATPTKSMVRSILTFASSKSMVSYPAGRSRN
jgi:cysteinyl-tRNA synthetase